MQLSNSPLHEKWMGSCATMIEPNAECQLIHTRSNFMFSPLTFSCVLFVDQILGAIMIMIFDYRELHCSNVQIFALKLHVELLWLATYFGFLLWPSGKQDDFKFSALTINLEGYHHDSKFYAHCCNCDISILPCFDISFSRSVRFQRFFILFLFKILRTALLELLMRSIKVRCCMELYHLCLNRR